MEYPPDKKKSRKKPDLKLEKASPEQLEEMKQRVMELEKSKKPPKAETTEERGLEHTSFSPAEYRKQANELLEELKTGLQTSGIAPAEVGKQWAALKIAHTKLLETTAQHRNARTDEERQAIENSIRDQMAAMRGGDAREDLSEAQQKIVAVLPKQRSSRRHRERLYKADTLQEANVVGAMERVMKAESEKTLNELDEREDMLRMRLTELEDMGEEGEEHKGILKELKTIDRKRRSATEAPPLTVPNIKTESVRSGIHADPTPETHKEQVQRLAELSTDRFNAYDQAMKKALGEDESTPAASASAPALEYDEAGAFLGVAALDNEDAAPAAAEAAPQPEPAASPEPATTPEKPKWNPMEPHPDGQDIVMVNSVLTRQAMGVKRSTDKKLKPFRPFPADSTSAATPEGRATRLARENRYKKEDRRKWLARGGLGVVAAGLLAFFGMQGKKAENADTRPVSGPPAAAKSAADAGLTLPSLDQPTIPGPPTTLTEGIPQSLSEWAGGAASKAEAEKAKKPSQAVSKPKAKPKAQKTGKAMTASAELSQSWDPAFNNWEDLKDGQPQRVPNSVKLPKVAADTGYTITGSVNDYPPPGGAAKSESAPAAAPASEASRPAVDGKLEVDPASTHLYTTPDRNEPGGEALVVYGGGAGTSNAFMEKLRAFAKAHPGRTIYFDPGVPTVVGGKEVPWIATAIFADGAFDAHPLPTRPELVGMQLNPETFAKKIG